MNSDLNRIPLLSSRVAGRYIDSDAFFRMANTGRNIESWLAGLTDEPIDLWTAKPKPAGSNDPFFFIGLDGNPKNGEGCVSRPHQLDLTQLPYSHRKGPR